MAVTTKVLSALLCLTVLDLCRAVKITVYQSTLSYYDTQWVADNTQWIEMSDSAKEIAFASRFECQFISLPFEFPYYSDKISKVGVTKLGFIYTGPYTNARLTELMHIAPLMNLYDNGTVFYDKPLNEDGTTGFVIHWNGVSVSNYTATFQLQMFLNGSMVFAYKNVSDVMLEQAIVSVDSAFPWTNAYTTGTKDLIYYQYEEVKVEAGDVTNGSALLLTLRTNCQSATNCTVCQEVASNTEFSCQWCPALQRCSDTFDSRYAEWSESCTVTVSECPENEVYNETLQVEIDQRYEEAIDQLTAWFESLAETLAVAETCTAGLFYNPYTGSCNDCVYCANVDCQEACNSATLPQTKYSDPKRNMKIKDYRFKKTGDNPWKSGFIGLVCGLVVCMCIGAMMMCAKRRNYQQPGGMNWSIPTDTNTADKPLIYGSSADREPI